MTTASDKLAELDAAIDALQRTHDELRAILRNQEFYRAAKSAERGTYLPCPTCGVSRRDEAIRFHPYGEF